VFGFVDYEDMKITFSFTNKIVHIYLFRLHSFASDLRYLQMDSTVLRNLEIFESSVGSYKGSLFWALDHTKTKFGSR
jgi:DNA mismatch repair ATPase MutS